jgi:hypothetical protein
MGIPDYYTGSHVPHSAWDIPLSVNLSRNSRTYPSGSDINPGYAYGTYIPLFTARLGLERFQHPYTIPLAGSQVRMWAKGGTLAVVDSRRRLRQKGLSDVVPGIDWTQINQVQALLANQ